MRYYLLIVLGVILVVQLLFFVFAAYYKTDKLTDLAYGSTFALIAALCYLLVSRQTLPQGLATLCVMLRGVRLSGYLFVRVLYTGRDQRFDGIRERGWSFLKFWLLQAVMIWIILLPVLVVLYGPTSFTINLLAGVGIAVWLIGRLLESIADWQKFTYKRQHPHHWVDTGVWSRARHPNYLGEILVWRGVRLLCYASMSLPWWTIVSPLGIMSLLLWVTGIPPLEQQHDQKYGSDPDYQRYKSKTRLLLPW